jgi:hypothetical protein
MAMKGRTEVEDPGLVDSAKRWREIYILGWMDTEAVTDSNDQVTVNRFKTR